MESKVKVLDFMKSKFDLALISQYIPKELIEEYKKSNSKRYRDRLYSMDVVLQGMLYQSLSEDKSEQNAVIFLHEFYSRLRKEIQTKEQELKAIKEAELSSEEKRKPGKPRKHFVKVQKSKMKETSLNTSSYDEARKRFPLDLLEQIFKHIRPELTETKLWNGHQVYIADGTTAKTVDTNELREHFMPKTDANPQPLPILRIEGLIDLYGGYLVDVDVNNYSSSEGKMFKKLYRSIPKNTVLLADDLYSSYGHFAYCQSKGVFLITQGKHKRQEKIVKHYIKDDVLVEWKSGPKTTWYTDKDNLPKTIQVRRISFKDPENPNKESYIYTNLIDPQKYKSSDILALYFCRWDIELSFREIKIVLGMEYLRSKTVEMVKKEILIFFILYNIIKIIMIKAMNNNNVDFFSQRKKVQIRSTISQINGGYVDKLGRTYARKSTGRYGILYTKKLSEAEIEKKGTKIG